MEGSDDLHSPLWVGARLIWADSHAWDGSNYDSSVVSLSVLTGRRTRVSLRDAYVLSLARAGGRLAVRYLPTDPKGESIAPDPRRKHIGALSLRRLS